MVMIKKHQILDFTPIRNYQSTAAIFYTNKKLIMQRCTIVERVQIIHFYNENNPIITNPLVMFFENRFRVFHFKS